jgi:Rrf2 family protein
MLSLPQTAEYALRAVAFIAEAPDGEPRRVAEIARATRVPRNYLSKTLHQLAQAGVLHSTRGPAGGFQLAAAAERLTLAEVIGPFMPVDGRACVLGRSRCSDSAPCAAHHRWKPVGVMLVAFFGATTVADLRR